MKMLAVGTSKSIRIIFLLITILLISIPVQAKYSGGTGEPNNPYQIATAQDLIDLGEEPNDYDKHFILTADIDLAGYVFEKAVIAPDVNDSEDWFQETDFTGVFDGKNHIISNLTIIGNNYLGLFGRSGSGAIISNLGLEAVDVNGIGLSIGGLVGENRGDVIDSYSTGVVSGGIDVGGLVGTNSGAGGSITSSYSTGTVNGYYVGGLVGGNGGVITACYSTGTVNGGLIVGGLIGQNIGLAINSYSFCSVSGQSDVGGFIGTNGFLDMHFGFTGDIINCYSTGSVNGVESTGGLIGLNALGEAVNSFWDIETSYQATSDGGTGLTTNEMQTGSTFTDAGWDFVGETVNGPNDVWKIVEGITYPLLSWQKYSGGTGEPNNPYKIATAEDLITLGEEPNDYDKYFILIDDVNLADYVFERAVIAPDTNDLDGRFQGTPFTGIFDGNSHIISNLTIIGDSYLGLFGQLEEEAFVSKLGLEAVDVNGIGYWVGGLVGYNDGIITSCYGAYGSVIVSNSSLVGGLVGDNYGTITNCYSTGDVSGIADVGGLVGRNNGTISSCYSTGAISGDWYVGGLLGNNNGAITSCFWDIETSGQSTSDGGTGLTTSQMQDPNTFLNAGWDFYDETFNGTCNFWIILDGAYPSLAVFSDYRPIEPNGSGTLDDPYVIIDANDLGTVWYHSEAHYRLEADINLSGITWNMAVVPRFNGCFEGNGHVIYLLQLEGGEQEELGLFGTCSSVASISNLGLEEIDVNGTGENVGGLVGINDGMITSCYSKGNVSGHQDIGGLVGINDGMITLCYSTSDVNGDDWYIGGLVGINEGLITSCYSTGFVYGYSDVGGLVGSNYGAITKSYSMGDVSSNSGFAAFGGLVGINDGTGTITSCYSTSNVNGGDWLVGGLVGCNHSTINSCYSMGTVNGGSYVGGLVGDNFEGKINSSYSTGSVIGDSYIGGFVGRSNFTITSSFWGIETSGQNTSDGGTGITTVEMQTESTFTDAGWDFVGETVNGPNDIWKMWDGYDYPRLAWESGPNTPLVFVDINDLNFYGQVSKYEVTNDQYCDFLNVALSSGDIIVNGFIVEGANGLNIGQDYAGQSYYKLNGLGWTGAGAISGSAARIHYNEGVFSVDSGFGNHPVTYVSWYGAMAFANYYGYYLPTEDQWQAVADYDGTYIYGCGETINPNIANYRDSIHPDGTLSVGIFGLYGYDMSDMSGNVWEWTSSSLDSSRIFRGGSWSSYDSDCDVSIRGDGIPSANYYDIGFRVCR